MIIVFDCKTKFLFFFYQMKDKDFNLTNTSCFLSSCLKTTFFDVTKCSTVAKPSQMLATPENFTITHGVHTEFDKIV